MHFLKYINPPESQLGVCTKGSKTFPFPARRGWSSSATIWRNLELRVWRNLGFCTEGVFNSAGKKNLYFFIYILIIYIIKLGALWRISDVQNHEVFNPGPAALLTPGGIWGRFPFPWFSLTPLCRTNPIRELALHRHSPTALISRKNANSKVFFLFPSTPEMGEQD